MEREPGFHLPIFKCRLSDEQFAYFLKVTDKMLEDGGFATMDATKQLVGEFKEGSQFSLNKALWHDFDQVLQVKMREYVLTLSNNRYRAAKASLIRAWMVSQRGGDYNPLHSHTGVLSGIIYLKTPDEIFHENSVDGYLNFSFGLLSPQSLHFMGTHLIRPVAGDMFLFPSWLSHTVYPFKGTAERRSISFNYDVTVDHAAP